eukprot:5044254-Amphidinium_carterae.1
MRLGTFHFVDDAMSDYHIQRSADLVETKHKLAMKALTWTVLFGQTVASTKALTIGRARVEFIEEVKLLWHNADAQPNSLHLLAGEVGGSVYHA